MGLYVAKIMLLATGLVAIFAVFLSSALSTGIVEMPKARYLIPLVAFAVIALISSAFSGAIKSSIVGSAFDLGTSGSLVMLVFALLMTIVAVRSAVTVDKAIFSFLLASLVICAYGVLASFGSSLLPNSLASKLPVFLAGGAIDTAITLGAAVILALCALNMTELGKKIRIALYVLMAYSMLFIGAVNFMPVIIVLGIVSLVFFVYILSWSVGRPEAESADQTQPENGRKISLSSLIILITSVILILGGSTIGGYLSEAMRTQVSEVRPNFETTMSLTSSAWKENFALGVGPNRFAEFWATHKPLEINQTQFWNSDFYSGSGFIPTIAVTTGLLGLLAFLAFLAIYAMTGIKAIFAQANSNRSRYLATASFLASLYLWVMFFVYTPGIAVMALAFIFTGLFTAMLAPQGIVGLWRVNIFSNPKTNFLSVLSIVLLLIVSIAGGYYVWERGIASVVFQRGVLEFQRNGDIPQARELVTRAINIAPNDVYWRGLAEISIQDLGRALSGISDQGQMTDSAKAEVQSLTADAVAAAKKAVEAGNGNFQNWFALGRVYEILASNGLDGALESARAAYAEAAARSPLNPSVPLALARLDALAGDVESARDNISKAVNLKSNYTDAYFTFAQLEAASNNITAAIQSVEAATLVDPMNSGLYFQLGILKYNQRDFSGAAGALERAVTLIPDYANAKYFLGLSYFELGRRTDAIKQFEEIKSSNPENSEIDSIIDNLRAGEDPFSDSSPLVSELPVEEE